VLRLSPDVAATVKKRFETVSNDLLSHSQGIPGLSGAISDGAGELSGELADGVTSFMQSWSAALDLLSTSTALIAGNTNNLAIDLDALDRGSEIDLSGNTGGSGKAR
jgi:preprotein translocase subunit SecG